MTGPSVAEIGELLAPYASVDAEVLEKLQVYVQLLVRWNARTNLTAIRDEQEMIRRHFGESLFAAGLVPKGCRTLLDFGSGAGFPGVPIQLVRPEIRVSLAESQGKKAAFLREVVRVLGLQTEVWGSRVEEMDSLRRFEVVAMRAVDRPGVALEEARRRLEVGGMVLLLAGEASGLGEVVGMPGLERGVVEVIAG